MIRRSSWVAIAAVSICALTFGPAAGKSPVMPTRISQPSVLVELFTSEGCSSCPPADALLEALEKQEPTSGVEAIVLSEHVDYWNHIGWTDPYSSPQFSERQSAYANRFGLSGVYTPQMVVDGANEFVGSDARRARAAIGQASQSLKANVHITPLGETNGRWSRVQVEVDPLPASLRINGADVYFAVAENGATSQVLSGENGGRRLHHVAVVRSLKMIGKINVGASFEQQLPVNLGKGADPSKMRFVAFVQERGQGRVLGSAMQMAIAP